MEAEGEVAGAGSHVVEHFVHALPDCNIVCLDKMYYFANERNLEGVREAPNFKFVQGDVASEDLLLYLLEMEGVDTVVHFAAQTHVDNSFGNSLQFTRDNVMATHVLLECCKSYGKIRRFIHVSTDEVYGETCSGKVDEESVLTPSNPYAATKAAAEALVKCYYLSFQVPVIITRGNNVYGPRQFPEKLIPKMALRLKHQQKCCIHGTGSQTRNFMFVEDVVSAFDTILTRGEIGMTYNIGSSFEISVRDVVQSVLSVKLDCRVSDEELEEHVEYVPDRACNDSSYHIDNSRLVALGWCPTVSWEVGLARTLAWYEENEDYWKEQLVQAALLPHPHFASVSSR